MKNKNDYIYHGISAVIGFRKDKFIIRAYGIPGIIFYGKGITLHEAEENFKQHVNFWTGCKRKTT